MSDKDLGYWLMLNAVPGVGPIRFLRLVERFGSARQVFEAGRSELLGILGMTPGVADSVLTAKATRSPEDDLAALRATQATAVTHGSAGYPPLLQMIYAPPPVLFCLGTLDALQSPSIAIVGSRRCTSGGRMVASSMARDLGNLGFVIVSGLARGIDTAAHRGALSGGGSTVAVLGCGIDVAYPPENAGLLHDVSRRGAVVSEFNPGTLPYPGNFPARNRVISGLCCGTVLVEAALKSGALITSEFAIRQDREFMAVPGSPLNSMAAGPNRLLKQGAGLVENAADVCSCLGLHSTLAATPPPRALAGGFLDTASKRVLRCLTMGPMGPDEIVADSDLAAAEVLSSLTTLQLAGRVVEHSGKVFSLPAD